MRSLLLITTLFFFSIIGFAQVNIGLGPFPDLCENGGTYTLTSGTPTGGLYSGNGVIGSIFNPAAAGAGSHAITYTYTDTSGTYDTTLNIIVNAAPNVTLGAFPTVCEEGNPIGLNQGSPIGGIYKGPGIIFNAVFFPDSVGVGLYTINYVYTDPLTGCADSATQNLIVNPKPNVNLVAFSPICSDQQAFNLVGGTPNGGIYIINGMDTVSNFDPQVFGADTHEVNYLFTDAVGCSSSAMQDLIINEVPDTPFVFPYAPDTLLCSEPGDVFEWFKNDSIVPQTTRKIAVANQDGVYKVRVTKAGCISEVSAPYTYGEPFSVKELGSNIEMNVFPNPSNGDVRIMFSDIKNANLEVFDIAGKLIFSQSIANGFVIEDEVLPKGTYIIKLTSSTKTATQKLIKL